jgi:uncharacterized protein (DUF2344 family)
LISKFFFKPDKIVVKRLDLKEPEMIQFADKVAADLLEQKMTQEVMKTHLMEVMQENKILGAYQAALVRRHEKLAKK